MIGSSLASSPFEQIFIFMGAIAEMLNIPNLPKITRGALLASVAAVAIAGTAHAGVIDISGQNSDGGSNVVAYNETDTGFLDSITFDISVEHFSPSWGNETRIGLTHTGSGYSVTFAGGTDFGWASSSGVFGYSSTVAIAGGPIDMSGAWSIDLYESFDDSGTDSTFGQGSTITLNSGGERVPEPGPLGLIGAGLVLAALRRRKKR